MREQIEEYFGDGGQELTLSSLAAVEKNTLSSILGLSLGQRKDLVANPPRVLQLEPHTLNAQFCGLNIQL